MRGLLRGLGPNVIALGFASFFTDVASEMVFPLMPMFLIGTLKASEAWLGLIEGLANSISSLLRIVSGWLSDRLRRRKPFIFWGYGLAAAVRPFFAFALVAWHVLVIRVIDRIGKGLRLAARDALLADSCEPSVRGKAFGLQHAMDNLGAALGPLVAFGLLWAGLDVRTIFFVTAIPAAGVLFVVGGFVKEIPGKGEAKPLRLTLKPFDGRFRTFLLIVTIFTLGNSSDAFLLHRATQLFTADWGFSAKQATLAAPLVWVGLCLVRMLAGIPAGIYADRAGKRAAVVTGWAIYAVVYALLGVTSGAGAFLAIVALYGLWSAFGDSVARALVADLVPAEWKGTAYGMYHFCVGLAALPASWGFGAVYRQWGATPAFMMGAAFAAVAWGLLTGLYPPRSASSAA